jgi:predicted alpha/beta hydrolase
MDQQTGGGGAREAESLRKDVTFQTQDAAHLAGTVFGDPTTACMAVVIHPATGVPASYYAHFASWLARSHHAIVLTYDYRDFGRSAHRPLRNIQTSMSDWGIIDQEAALRHLVRHFGHLPVRIIGHSLGAQWLAFHADIDKVDRVVAVAAGPAFWLHHAPSYMPTILWFWWIGMPFLTLLFGYMPGKRTGLGADLPGNVYWQWRRWCLSPHFSRPDWGKALPMPKPEKARFHLTLVPIADDVMIPPAMVRKLAAFYPEALISEDLIIPSDEGLKEIGHLRLFSPRCRAFWPRIAAPLVN